MFIINYHGRKQYINGFWLPNNWWLYCSDWQLTLLFESFNNFKSFWCSAFTQHYFTIKAQKNYQLLKCSMYNYVGAHAINVGDPWPYWYLDPQSYNPNGSRHSTKCQPTGAFRTVFFSKLFLLFITVWNKEVTV